MSHQRLNLTSQQRAALSRREVSVALSAGAGCGKTFVLTQRFLAHLQPGSKPDPLSGIVAITFTDRAAREMRDRIREACQTQLQECASKDVTHWLKILRGLDSARISTIHSFCSGLLRTHAVDAGLDPRFGLLEETLGDTFLQRVVDEAVRERLARQDEDCMQLVLHYGLERTVDLLRSLMSGRFQADVHSFAHHTPESLAAEWLNRWHEVFVPRRLNEIADSETAQSLLRHLSENEPSHPEMQKRRETLLAHLPALQQAEDPVTALADIRTAAQVQGGGGKSVWDNEVIYEQVKGTLKQLREQIDRLVKDMQIDESQVQAAAHFGLMASRLLRHLDEQYETRKQEAACLDFDDLLLKTRNLLRDSEPIRNRAAGGIDFLMVDEFQDTDPVQADIVRTLCGEDLLSGKLFVVGDANQSIYRFRRADPKVFSALRSELPEEGQLPLSTNFRSQPDILNFVNCLFALSMGDSYEPLVPFETKQLSPPPSVEFLFAFETELTEEDKPRETAAESRRREAEWMARRIVGLLNDETPRIRVEHPQTGETDLRPVQQGDVTILFRTLSHVALYEEALRRYGIEYYLVGSRAFYAQQEVYDLVNLCRYLADDEDQVSLAGILRSPLFSLSDNTLFALCDKWDSLGEAIRNVSDDSVPKQLTEEQQSQAVHAARVLTELRRKKDRIGLARLLSLAVERTGYDAALLGEFLGHRKVANLHKLIDKARQFDQSGLLTLPEFVERLQQSVTEQSDEELAATQSEVGDVVRLMTVHQSKGLEFPVVIVADMDWARRGGSSSPTFHPQLGPLLPLPARFGETPKNLGQIMHRHEESREDEQESIRLFYVATTRACDHLILSAGLGADRRGKSPWMKLLSQRFNLDTGLPAVDPYLGKVSLGDVSADKIPEIGVHLTPPDIPDSVTPASTSQQLPLSRFRESVAQSAADPLPELLNPVKPSPQSFRRFSVSAIEKADAEIRGTSPTAFDQPLTSFSSFDESAATDSTTLGELIHAVLERMDYQSPQWEPLLQACIAGTSGTSVASLRDSALTQLQAFQSSSLFAELQSAQQCYREIDFLLKWPFDNTSGETVTITGQIDCLMQTVDDQWKIFDYKTGRVSQKDPEAVLKEYDIQLLLYALAVREYLGRVPDSIELVLLKSNAVGRVSFEMADDVVADVRERIDAAVEHLHNRAGG